VSACVASLNFTSRYKRASSNLVDGNIGRGSSREQVKERKHGVSHSRKGKLVPRVPPPYDQWKVHGRELVLCMIVGQQKKKRLKPLATLDRKQPFPETPEKL